jgi:hypothetical protein
MFKDSEFTNGEIYTFVKYGVQIAGLDAEGTTNVYDTKIKYAFLLAQIEESFYIRY